MLLNVCCVEGGYAVKRLLCIGWVCCETSVVYRVGMLLNVCCVEGGYAVKRLLCGGWVCYKMTAVIESEFVYIYGYNWCRQQQIGAYI